MINTDYSSLYGQYINARNSGKSNGRMKDKTHMSDSESFDTHKECVSKSAGGGYAPQMSRSVLSAAFNAAYDDSGEIEQIQNTGRDSDSENFDVDSE